MAPPPAAGAGGGSKAPGRAPSRIVRERVTADGIHQYCVAWSHLDNKHAGFTWEESLTLYDSGHGQIVRQFESSAALTRSGSSGRTRSRGDGSRGGGTSLAPLASPIAPDQPMRPSTVDPLMPDAVRHSRVRLGDLQHAPQLPARAPVVGDTVRLTPGLAEPACGWTARGPLTPTSTGVVVGVLQATRECAVEFQTEASTLQLGWAEIQLVVASPRSSSIVQFESPESRDASLHVSQQGRPSSAGAVLAPLSSKQPAVRKSRSTSGSRSKKPGELSALAEPSPKSGFKSLFDPPPFDPRSVPPPRIGVRGYVPVREGLTRARGRSVHRVLSTSNDELRRSTMKAQVRQFMMVKRGCDEARMQHLTFKQPGIPGSYDRYTFMLHTAAVRIQAWLRGFVARAQIRLWHASAIQIQRFVRGHIGRLRYDEALIFQRKIRWRFRKLGTLVVCRELAAWRGRLRRLTQDCLGTRDQRNSAWTMSAFAENRDQEIQGRIEAYLILLKWAEEQRKIRLAVCGAALADYVETAVSSSTDPSEMLRAYLTEQGRAQADVAKLVADSEALRVQLSQDNRIAHTQREISELMFHMQDFNTQFEFHTPHAPPDSHFAPDAITAKRERAFVEFRLYSSKRPSDDTFAGAHYITLEVLRSCNLPHPADCATVCKLKHGDQQYELHPTDDEPSRKGIRKWGGAHTFRVDGPHSTHNEIACTFVRSDDPMAKLGEFVLKINDLIAANEPVCRYTWLTIRKPKPTVQVRVNVNKKEAEYGDSGHWEGTLTVQVLRATGLEVAHHKIGYRDAVRIVPLLED
jgi:hypothetical protein